MLSRAEEKQAVHKYVLYIYIHNYIHTNKYTYIVCLDLLYPPWKSLRVKPGSKSERGTSCPTSTEDVTQCLRGSSVLSVRMSSGRKIHPPFLVFSLSIWRLLSIWRFPKTGSLSIWRFPKTGSLSIWGFPKTGVTGVTPNHPILVAFSRKRHHRFGGTPPWKAPLITAETNAQQLRRCGQPCCGIHHHLTSSR